MQKVFGIWYLKYQIPSPQKVFRKVFKCPQINMYLVFGIFDLTLTVQMSRGPKSKVGSRDL